MLSVLTVEKAGSNKSIEMSYSSPEGENTAYLVGQFLAKYILWTQVILTDDNDVIVLRDGNGDLWVTQSQVYNSVCFVEQEGE